MTIRDGTTMAGVDMSADRGQQSASVGADTPIWLATLPSVNTSPHPTSNSADGLDGADGAGGADIVSVKQHHRVECFKPERLWTADRIGGRVVLTRLIHEALR